MAWDGVSDFYEDDEPEEAILAAQRLAKDSGLVTISISVRRRSDHVEEGRLALSCDELNMPGYVEHVIRGYDGTDWEAQVVYDVPD